MSPCLRFGAGPSVQQPYNAGAKSRFTIWMAKLSPTGQGRYVGRAHLSRLRVRLLTRLSHRNPSSSFWISQGLPQNPGLTFTPARRKCSMWLFDSMTKQIATVGTMIHPSIIGAIRIGDCLANATSSKSLLLPQDRNAWGNFG